MSRQTRSTVGALVLVLGMASGAVAQGATLKVKEEKKGMLKTAKVAPADAIKTAQAQFPNAKIKSGEIEKEDGRLIYSFDVQQPGVKGIEEVNIDANTGAVLKTEHEDPATEKKEARAEKPAKAVKPVKKPPA